MFAIQVGFKLWKFRNVNCSTATFVRRILNYYPAIRRRGNGKPRKLYCEWLSPLGPNADTRIRLSSAIPRNSLKEPKTHPDVHRNDKENAAENQSKTI